MFARFGSQVTWSRAPDRLLPLEEPEAGDLLAGCSAARASRSVPARPVARVAHAAAGFTVTLRRRRGLGAALLVATGRRVDLAAVGAAPLGHRRALRALPVDDRMRAAPGVWAVGDITGKGAFTHMSMYQADIAVGGILGQGGRAAEYHAVPRVTFTDPEIGAVGMTEAQARGRAAGADGHDQTPSSRGWIHRAGNDGFVKLVEDAAAGCWWAPPRPGPGRRGPRRAGVAVHAGCPSSGSAR